MKHFLRTLFVILTFSSLVWSQNREGEWNLTIHPASVNLLPNSQENAEIGFIAERKTFEALWRASNQKTSPVPDVNFQKKIVLFARNGKYFNAIKIVDVSVAEGVVSTKIMETRGIRGVNEVNQMNISFKAIPREGVKALMTDKGKISIP